MILEIKIIKIFNENLMKDIIFIIYRMILSQKIQNERMKGIF